ncbi:pinin-like [Periplaneta americana]|uniref:pinin-like n=1 Tax=Periplaneta americana TaxID=6978 RepID=UPI0037E81AC4
MATEIMKSFGALQAELEKAKDNLKGVDEHIKKLIGRDPSEGQQRPGVKRPVTQPEEFRGRGRGFTPARGRRDPGGRPEEEESPLIKRRPGDPRTVFSRLSGPPRLKRDGDSGDEEDITSKPAISSRVIATPKELPSRQEAMAAQSTDERSKARNKRMFGALLGTLQKFRQEETRMRDKEEKRAKVEKKLEENAKREKEELKKERQELFQERKRKQAEIKKIELKMLRIKEQDEWEAKHRHLLNFIQTRSKPHIFYLPKSHNLKTEERLVASQKIVAKMIEKKRQEVQLELEAIEKRGRWRQGLGDSEGGLGQATNAELQAMVDLETLEAGDKENRLEGGDDLNVDNNENIEVPETGKVDIGVERIEEGQKVSNPISRNIETEMEVEEFRNDERVGGKESLVSDNLSVGLIKKEVNEDEDEEEEDDEEEDEDEEEDNDDDDEEEDNEGSRKEELSRDSPEKEIGSNKEELTIKSESVYESG